MNKEKNLDKIIALLNSFNQSYSDLDFALFLFAEAANNLNKIKQKAEEEKSAFYEHLKKKLPDTEILLKTAHSKFKTQHFKLGQHLTDRYLTLITKIKKEL